MADFELTGFSAITPISRGGFSDVYRACDDLTGRWVALKAIDAGGLPAAAREAFRREAAALGSLSSHPHIVTLYQAIDLGDRLVLVLELCEESLHDQLARSGPVSVATVVSHGVKIAAALATAHGRDMIHRDVKPENVLLTSYGEPALADFGIARLQASKRQTTATGLRAFTAVHAPPEILHHEKVGPTADVYELGSTLYTLLAGQPPFAGAADEPLATTVLRILREPMPPLVRDDVPKALHDLLKRALSKDPADRPSSALQVALELNAVEHLLGVPLSPLVVPAQPLRPAAPEDETASPQAGTARSGRSGTTVAGGPARVSSSHREVVPVPVMRLEAVGFGSRNNLPSEVSSFVGRTRELRDIQQLLDRARLVTLTGAGGSGKTRIALRVGALTVDDVRDGVVFVDLAGLTADDSVAAAIADGLGVKPEPGRSPTESFAVNLSDSDAMVILDNCEHVVDQCVRVVDALLRHCWRLRVVATSRQPLGIDGEHLYRISPLSLPRLSDADGGGAAEAVAASEAGALFVERAVAQVVEFRLDESNAAAVARICRRLDGIPLALELAAAHLRSMSVDDLDGHLDEMFRILTRGSRAALPRQRTLLATIEWSYDLLDGAERLLLERLGVFTDGFDLAAVEAVCAGPGRSERLTMLDTLVSLVDKSLVQLEPSAGAARYRMLETIRAFAGERLTVRGEDAVRERGEAHATYFLAAALDAVGRSDGAEREAGLDALRRDHENLHTALRFFLSSGERIDDALRLAGALFPYWKRGGHYVEGARMLERCLVTARTKQDPALRAACLHAAGSLLVDCGDIAAARGHLEEGAALAAGHGEFRVLAGCRHELALVLFRQGAYGEARELIEGSVSMAEQSGDPEFLARARCDRGHFTTDAPDLAQADLEHALGYFRAVANRRMAATALDGLAHIALERGDVETARAHFEEGLGYAASSHDDDQLQYWVVNLAFATLLNGDAVGGSDLAERAATLARRTRSVPFFPYVLLALALSRSAQGDRGLAAQLHGAADALLEVGGVTFEPFEAGLRRDDQAQLKTKLGSAAFEVAYSAGRPLGFSQALRLVGFAD